MVQTRVVLLVHPHADTREMYAEYLNHTGWSVLEAVDADHAMQLVAQADVVVTGLRLDGAADGADLMRMLRQDPQLFRTPIIVMTAQAFPADRQRAEAAGCDAFLSMPCLPEALAREISRVLEARRLPMPLPVKAHARRPAVPIRPHRSRQRSA